MHRSLVVALVATLIALTALAATGQTLDRSTIQAKDSWSLADIFPSDGAWNEAKDRAAGRFDEILQFKGNLSGSAGKLLECLKLRSEISKELARLSSYAAMKSDEDTRVAKYQGMKQQISQLATDFGSRASFISPEITAIEDAKIDGFVDAENGLKPFRMYLNDIQRTKAHRLSQQGEKILAEAGLLAGGPQSIYSIFTNAEFPFPEIKLSDDTPLKVNQAGFGRYRSSPHRADREAVFQAFFGTYGKFKQTLGAQLNAQVKKDMFFARARQYDSSLHAALDGDNIPVEVYHTLVKNVADNLDSFHRYLRLKKRMLGVDQLRYSDVYAPVVKGVELEYSYDQARQLVLEALQPLGEDYVGVVRRSFDERWIDVYPTPGKRMGAYCQDGCYDVHPYILLNYNGRYEDVSTLAHELGHALHSHYAQKTQPYPTADYSTFVAEVASTLDEALLLHMMLQKIEDNDVRLSLMMNYLDGVKGTVFRQTQFAEFELAAHEKAERGEPLTGDSLTEVYGEILKRYYGHDQGVCHIDEPFCVEWSYVPHFYYNFYVYQYATSFTASTALSEKILSGEPGAVAKTIEFLSAGGSAYPIQILKNTGVDMTASDPFDRTMAAMNRMMDEIEKILDERTESN